MLPAAAEMPAKEAKFSATLFASSRARLGRSVEIWQELCIPYAVSFSGNIERRLLRVVVVSCIFPFG